MVRDCYYSTLARPYGVGVCVCVRVSVGDVVASISMMFISADYNLTLDAVRGRRRGRTFCHSEVRSVPHSHARTVALSVRLNCVDTWAVRQPCDKFASA